MFQILELCVRVRSRFKSGQRPLEQVVFSIPIASVMFHSTSLHLSSPRFNFLLHSTQPNSLPLNFTHFTPTSPHLSSHFHSPTPCSTPLNPTHFHSTSLTSPQPHIIWCVFCCVGTTWCGHDMVCVCMYWCVFLFVWTTWCVLYALVSLFCGHDMCFVWARHVLFVWTRHVCFVWKAFLCICVSQLGLFWW